MTITSRIANQPAWWAMLSVNITRMATSRFMTRWCGWRRIFPCACRCLTGRAISARSTATRPPPCVIPKCGWQNPPMRCLTISTKTRLIFRTITTIPSASRLFCQRGSRTFWSMAQTALPWAWRRMCRRIIWVRWSTGVWPSLIMMKFPIWICWRLCPGPISRQVASFWALPARGLR